MSTTVEILTDVGGWQVVRIESREVLVISPAYSYQSWVRARWGPGALSLRPSGIATCPGASVLPSGAWTRRK